MITEIYIEDTRLDLSKDLSSEFTYAIDDIQDFASRNTNFSKTIILPGNAVNNKIFGHTFEFTSSNFYNPSADNVGYNFNAAKAASCVIYVDKIQVFKGIIRLLEITIDRGTIEYECAVFGELGGFITALNNLKLENLDFSSYDHQWSYNNIVNSWQQASGTTASGMGYYYPLIDYGQVSHPDNNHPKRSWLYKALRPALFVREYFDKIITNSGYTWEGDFLNSNLFKRLIIPNNQKSFSRLKNYNFQRRNSSYTFTELDGTSKLFPLSISELTQNYTPNGAFTQFTYTGTSFSGQYETDIRLSWQKNSSIPFHFDVLVNGTTIGTHSWESSSSNTPIVFELKVTGNITLNTNDIVSFRFRQDIASDFELIVQIGQGLVKIQTPGLIPVDFVIGDMLEVNQSVPKGIFQRDFISSIIKMFNLYIVEDTTRDKHLKIIPFIDFYTTTANFLQVNDLEEELLVDNTDLLLLDDYSASHIDWTAKVDRKKAFKLKPMSELNGRFFEFKYKSDADYYNEDYSKNYAQGYADHIEDTGYDFANDKQTSEVIFSATPLVGYSGEDKVFPTIFKLSNTQNTQSEDPVDHNIRIMQVRKVNDVTTWFIKDGNQNIGAGLTSYGYAGHLDDPDVPTGDINFGVPNKLYFSLSITYPSANLFNGFWSDYVAEITDKDSKLLTCYLYLKITDIYGLDFSKLIYIDGALWRLNKVIDYNPTNPESTKCEFLRLIELTYE
jgi:hypothetical protein